MAGSSEVSSRSKLVQVPGGVRRKKGSFCETHSTSVSKSVVTSEKRHDPIVRGHRGVR